MNTGGRSVGSDRYISHPLPPLTSVKPSSRLLILLTVNCLSFFVMYNSTTHGSVKLGLPPLKIFDFPSQPHKVAPHLRVPPSNIYEPRIFYFFDINPDVFHAVVNLRFVLTFILTYVTTVLLLNQYNVSRQYRPWAISKSSLFKTFVFVHNALLSLFSAWVLIGIVHGAIVHRPRVGEHDYFASMVEFMCQTDTDAFQREFYNLFYTDT